MMQNFSSTEFRRKLGKFLFLTAHEKFNFISSVFSQKLRGIYYRFIFMEFGKDSAIPNPLRITNAHYIKIGHKLQAWPGLRLEALVTKPTRIPQLIIEDDVIIGQNTQIISHCKVIIRKGAGIGPHCFIMDVGHPILDRTSSVPIAQRFATEDSFIEIGEGALLGAGTVIMPNVRIGKGAVVGSNSVVRKSLPDNCVASGNPASVQLLYDTEKDRWLPAKPAR